MIRCRWSMLLLVGCCLLAYGKDLFSFDSSEQKQQFDTLLQELRCVVCQNQSLMDSETPLAQQMRAEIAKRIQQGEAADSIKASFVERYGQFIQLKPAWNIQTVALWLTPAALLFMMIVFFVQRVRRHD